jgi:hypothetical protein
MIPPPEAVRVIIPQPVGASGGGSAPLFIENISNPWVILVRSDTRALSLAEPANPQRLMKAMVPRMTRIVMTTMSSTSVKPL